MRATKTQAKEKHSWENVNLSPEINLFFSECFFHLSKCFFGNRQQSNARSGQKKTLFFFSNALPKFNMHAHSKTEKKNIVALT